MPKLMAIASLALAVLIGCGTEPTETTSAAADIEDALPFAPTTVAERAPSRELATTTTVAPTATTTTTQPPTTTTAPPPPPPKTAAPQPLAASGGCHPSYDPCLAPASDYDCEGGGGNGPAYTGRVNVIGPDEYELDRDGNGVGCE